MKRTYNLSADAIATVKQLTMVDHIAPSQDAVVEQAITNLAREVRDAKHARLWEQAARDPDFQEEMRQVERDLPGESLDQWEQ